MSLKKKKIADLCIKSDASLLSALKQMDEIERKLLIVIEEAKFKGILSIGDLQRAILKNISLRSPVKKILRENVTIASDTDDFNKVKSLMINNRIEFMPVINSDGDLVDVNFWEEIFRENKDKGKSFIDNPVVIMAGGAGSRVRPFTDVIPKAMLPLGKKPIIRHIIDMFSKYGFHDYYITLNYKAEIIKNYLLVNDNDIKYNYIEEPKPLGTAGGLSFLKKSISTPFFVSYCDVIIDHDFTEILDFHKKKKNILTVIAVATSYKSPYGVINSDSKGNLISFEEKPQINLQVNAGLYVLDPGVLDFIPPDKTLDFSELIKIVKKNHKVGVFTIEEKSWTDIGDIDKDMKAQNLFQ